MPLQPAGHDQRLEDDRVEPRLEHEALRRPRLQVVRHLQPALGVHLVREVGGQRAPDVEAEPLADERPADPAALQQQAGRDRPGADHHRLGAHPQRPPAGQCGHHRAGAPAVGLHRLNAALGQDAHPVAEALLRERQRRLEHRLLLAVATADVAVTAADAALDVGRHHRVGVLRVLGLQRLRAAQEQPSARVQRARPAVVAREPLVDDRQRVLEVRERVAQPAGVKSAVQVAIVEPAPQHRLGDLEADAVVDHRASPHAAALRDREAEVGRQLEGTVGVQRAVLGGLVLGEVGRRDVAAALEHEHAAPAVGQLEGERRPGGAAADDDHVGVELGADAVGVQAARPRPGVGRRRLLGMQRREGCVLGDRRPARVSVVAEVGQLRGGVDEVLADLAQRVHAAAGGHVGDEAPADVPLARRRRHHGQRRVQREQRVDGEREQRQAQVGLRGRLERGQEGVDPRGHLGAARPVRAVGVDEHLGHRGQRAVLDAAEAVEVEARPLGALVEPPEGAGHGRRDDDPGPGERRGGDAERGPAERVRARPGVAEGEHDEQRRDEEQVAGHQQQHGTRVAAHVGRPDDAEQREHPVLGRGVDDERIVGRPGEPEREVAGHERGRQPAEGDQREAQLALLAGDRGRGPRRLGRGLIVAVPVRSRWGALSGDGMHGDGPPTACQSLDRRRPEVTAPPARGGRIARGRGAASLPHISVPTGSCPRRLALSSWSHHDVYPGRPSPPR